MASQNGSRFYNFELLIISPTPYLWYIYSQGGRKSVPRVPPVPGSKRPQGEEVPKETKNNIVFSERYEHCGRNNSQGERVVACVCEITIKGLSGKSLRIFFQFSKIFQGSLKILFFKPYQLKMRNIVDLNSIVVRTKCPCFWKKSWKLSVHYLKADLWYPYHICFFSTKW